MSRSDVRRAFKAARNNPPHAIVVTLSAPRASGSPFSGPVAPPRLMADSHANIVAIMDEYGIRKIVTMAAFGVGDSFPNMHFILRLMVKKSNMSYEFEDHNLVDKEMKATDTDYVLVRPTMLTEGNARPVKEFGNLGEGVGLTSRITIKSVAVFLVDAAEKSTWDRTTPVITN